WGAARAAYGSGVASQVRLELRAGRRAVGLPEAVEELPALEVVLLGADGLQGEAGQHGADLGAPPVPQPPGDAGEEPGAVRVADARGVDALDLRGDRHVDGVGAAAEH